MDQHEFVAKCYARYAELGLEPGNPDDGEWQDAHYPAPDPEGDATIPLLFDDHQVQGLLQSEEYGRRCFWSGHAKKFLTHGPFVENWFELCGVYDRWMKEMNEKLHEEKNEEGKSVIAVENGKNMCKKLHEEKNEKGKSVHAVNSGKKGGAGAHRERDEEGRSISAIENGKKSFSQKWMNTDPNWPPFISHAGALSCWQKARGIDKKCRVRIL